MDNNRISKGVSVNLDFKFHAQTSRACGLALQCIESHSSKLLRNATRAIHTRATKCVEVGGDTFENL